jgi:hypothetical protein
MMLVHQTFGMDNWYLSRQDILPSVFALTVYIQFSSIVSFFVIDSRAMGFTSTNHGDGRIGINSVKD